MYNNLIRHNSHHVKGRVEVAGEILRLHLIKHHQSCIQTMSKIYRYSSIGTPHVQVGIVGQPDAHLIHGEPKLYYGLHVQPVTSEKIICIYIFKNW